jgi:curved DNA-binding protein CbpA
LWLGGFLYRENWNPAFPDRKISEINSARLALKKEEESDVQKKAAIFSAAKPPVLKSQPPQPVAGPIVKQTEEKPLELSLEEYLERAENSVSYYEFFDISPDAEISAIKRVYFFFAKRFHPDRFHQETDADLLQRIQNAFSLAAQAYEILKDEDKRRTYDLKLRKHLEDLRFKDISSKTQKTDREELAKEAFDQGFNLLMEDEIDEALPYLARAVQFAPKNARYHAYYGKALSFDENQRFKADTEMQTAVRLDPQNATYRIILAEFYIYYELFKRAEGELQRLLAIYPDNEEARMLLDSLPKK